VTEEMTAPAVAAAADRPVGSRKARRIATTICATPRANVLVMLAGFRVIPVMTRLLDTTSTASLGTTTHGLLILAGVFKLGAQHTILRFYRTPAVLRTSALRRELHFAAVAGSSALWLLAVAAYALILVIAPRKRPGSADQLLLLLPTIWISYVNAFAYAVGTSDTSVLISVGQRWCETLSI